MSGAMACHGMSHAYDGASLPFMLGIDVESGYLCCLPLVIPLDLSLLMLRV